LQMHSRKLCAKKATRLSSGEVSWNTPLSLPLELGCQLARFGQIKQLVSVLYPY